MKLHKESTPLDIPVNEMQDGQVAVITAWTVEEHEGRVVQRYGDTLITLGKSSGNSWYGVLSKKQPDCRVRILPPGTLLEVE